jgi:hypothetical protein
MNILLTRSSLINNIKEVVVHLAQDEYGTISKDVDFGKIEKSILMQTMIFFFSLLVTITYFKEYMPGMYGVFYGYIGSIFLAVLYYLTAVREYRAICTLKMHEIIKEYAHHELADRHILRRCLNKIRNEDAQIVDFNTQVRATFLLEKELESHRLDSCNKIITQSEEVKNENNI